MRRLQGTGTRAGEGPRVALVTNVMAHYRVSCFERLAARLPGRITFFLLAEEMEHRRYVLAARGAGGGIGASESLPVSVLRERRRWRRPPFDDVHWNDVRPVTRGAFDVLILSGWSEPTFLLLWLHHLMRRTRVLFWCESTARDFPRRWAREAVKRVLLRAAAGCIVPGRRSGEYCRQLGVPEERLFVAPNATDRDFFRRRAERLAPRRGSLRRELNLEGLSLLFVGRLVESLKGVAVLLRAVAALESRGLAVTLSLAGDGPDRRRYEALAAELGCRDVRFLGILDHEALCLHYAAADVLVLPSRSEPWGFVLNEGMEFGLPLVVSDAVGAGPDLVRPGENGYRVPAGDVPELAAALNRMAGDRALRHGMGRASRALIEDYSPESWARGVLRAIRAMAG